MLYHRKLQFETKIYTLYYYNNIIHNIPAASLDINKTRNKWLTIYYNMYADFISIDISTGT